jgi:ankyrin repeat protein
MTPLIAAAFGPYSRPSDPGRLEVARILLEAGADADALTEEWEWLGEWGRSAITFGSEEMAELLRDHGATVTVHVAGVRGWTDELTRLLDEDPSLVEWSPMERSSSPLRTALCAGGHVEAVRILLDRGADPTELSRLGTTQTAELAVACRVRAAGSLSPRHAACARLLVERGAPITIHDAATLGLTDVVERMLTEQPELLNSISPRHGMTPLHWAVVGGHPGLAEQLLDRGAQVDARSRSGATPLLLAVRPFEGRAPAPADVESIRLLLDRGADVDAADRDGLTPLGAAEEGGPQAVAELLRKHAGRTL